MTLSACQTGLGSGHFAEVPSGDDFVGLTRAFLYAGRNSVLATLWEVDDASTLGLMKISTRPMIFISICRKVRRRRTVRAQVSACVPR